MKPKPRQWKAWAVEINGRIFKKEWSNSTLIPMQWARILKTRKQARREYPDCKIIPVTITERKK